MAESTEALKNSPMPTRAGVSVYLRGGIAFISATYSPGPGTYVDRAPVFSVPISEIKALGECIRSAIQAFRAGGEMPDWQKYQSPVLLASGIGTWEAFERGLRSCFVEIRDGFMNFKSENPPGKLEVNSSCEDIGIAARHALAPLRGGS